MQPSPSPFQISQGISNVFGNVQRKYNDTSAIDEILTQASSSGNQQDIDNAIGQILTRVSPERQPMALQILQQKKAELQGQAQDNSKAQAYSASGLDPSLRHLDPKTQAQFIKGQQAQQVYSNITGQSGQKGVPAMAGQGAPGMQQDVGQQAQTPSALSQLSDDQVIQLSGLEGYSEPAKQELRRRQEDRTLNQKEAAENRHELAPYKKEIMDKANSARKGIQNKQNMIGLIKTKKIDDPTYATVLENLPLDLGKRLLSKETVQYKAAMVDEFSDLRNVFQGQTRVKEIEIMEEKIANLYLTDEQKEAILRSRIDALQVDVLREEAMQEVEESNQNLTLTQFNKKVNELAKNKNESLFGRILDDQKRVLEQAESRKQYRLNADDPEDAQIIEQMVQESGGSEDAFLKLVKQKGYRFQ